MTPILLLGAGRMGGALIEGWRLAGAFDASELILRDPMAGPVADAAQAAGARLNPHDSVLAEARTVVLAVKPQIWREVAVEVAPWLHASAIVVSIAAGVRLDDLTLEFGGRSVARVMPTTAAAIGRGTASLYADDPQARLRARALFEPLGEVVDLLDEAQMHAATAVSGSAPAYLYAFLEALEAAGVEAGLSSADASRLARATIGGAAALLAKTGEEPAELRRQVTSPGGTTEAALGVLLGDSGLHPLLREAVARAVRRSKELGG
ncbi:pyrroline-5-carboxylate reductase [Phenylobacterium sp.]|uniref:pyrroline-5-carboxylate reductase n=1 Tax=Phenylobacterium sp. TaxID=1871053 RepID=UPI0027366C90|nr:pyrroline-5-carboxylate reductase [Phenylobacterium sp.]MDP3658720.1 pyrroline-5-carboxylate reductase [Phenylobacterium sp.]